MLVIWEDMRQVREAYVGGSYLVGCKLYNKRPTHVVIFAHELRKITGRAGAELYVTAHKCLRPGCSNNVITIEENKECDFW
jgi:hypothetical protein